MNKEKYDKMEAIRAQCMAADVIVPQSVKEYLAANESLETTFRKAFSEHGQDIADQLEIAQRAFQQAKNLSDDTGIPFVSTLSEIGEGAGAYEPYNYDTKFRGLNHKVLEEITGIYNLRRQSEGWDSSSMSC